MTLCSDFIIKPKVFLLYYHCALRVLSPPLPTFIKLAVALGNVLYSIVDDYF